MIAVPPSPPTFFSIVMPPSLEDSNAPQLFHGTESLEQRHHQNKGQRISAKTPREMGNVTSGRPARMK
jgi:hypothetical protein